MTKTIGKSKKQINKINERIGFLTGQCPYSENGNIKIQNPITIPNIKVRVRTQNFVILWVIVSKESFLLIFSLLTVSSKFAQREQ